MLPLAYHWGSLARSSESAAAATARFQPRAARLVDVGAEQEVDRGDLLAGEHRVDADGGARRVVGRERPVGALPRRQEAVGRRGRPVAQVGVARRGRGGPARRPRRSGRAGSGRTSRRRRATDRRRTRTGRAGPTGREVLHALPEVVRDGLRGSRGGAVVGVRARGEHDGHHREGDQDEASDGVEGTAHATVVGPRRAGTQAATGPAGPVLELLDLEAVRPIRRPA